MNVTLTGAAGRVGSAVCRHLVTAGHTVKAVDRTYRKDLPVAVKLLDLLRREDAYEALEGAEFLVHLANSTEEEDVIEDLDCVCGDDEIFTLLLDYILLHLTAFPGIK